jgi:transposase
MEKGKIRKVRRRYDEEFKRNAVGLITEERSTASVAASLGIDKSQLYQWRKKYIGGAEVIHVAEDEVSILRRRVLELEEERDILKKALSIFSRQTK